MGFGFDNVEVVPAAPLSGGIGPWDVNRDGVLAPLDALLLINELTARSRGTTTIRQANGWEYDVNGDGESCRRWIRSWSSTS